MMAGGELRSMYRMRMQLLIATMLVFSSIGVATTAFAASSQCTAQETVVFSYKIGRKLASLCASSDIGPSRGSLRYAFGRHEKPEMVYPEPGTRGRFFYRLLAKGDAVRFVREGVSYTLFSEFRDGAGDVEGLVITKQNGETVHMRCKLGALGPDGWAPVYRAQLPEDPEEHQFLEKLSAWCTV